MSEAANMVFDSAATGLLFAGTVFAIWVVTYCATDIESDTFADMMRAERFAIRLSVVAGTTAAFMRLIAQIWGAA